MKHPTRLSSVADSSILPYAAGGLAVLIFIVDTVTDLEIAVAVFYITVVLLSVSFLETRGVVFVSLGCMALTLISYYLTPKGALQAGFINCVISCAAIGVSTYLALKIESAEVAAHEARAQLAHCARLTALGELTASIAHEVNQPLAAIATSGDTCLRWLNAQPPNLEKARRAADRIVADANRASEVTVRVRSLARRAPLQKSRFGLNEAILEILGLTHSELQMNQVSLQTKLADDLPLIFADRIQLQQVILNLIINSVEALGSVGGRPRQLVVRSEKGGSNNILVSVSDSGPGLDIKAVDQVFDPFYTTKRDGMGIGLAIARTIIEAHGGRIWATAGTPFGATFAFTLLLQGGDGS